MSSSKFDIYINKVLKQVHPECSISANAKSQVNYFLNILAKKLIDEAKYLMSGKMYSMKNKKNYNRKSIMSSRNLQTAVRIILPGELSRHAISEGCKAVTKFTSAISRGSKSRKAGLVFPVARVKNIIKNENVKVSEGCPVYLAGVLEYISAEILELSGNIARDNNKKVISTRDVMKAISNDEELKKLSKKLKWTTLGGGQDEFIHYSVSSKIEKNKSRALAKSKAKTKARSLERKRSIRKTRKRKTSKRRGESVKKQGHRCNEEDDLEPLTLEPLSSMSNKDLFRASDSKCYSKEALRMWFAQQIQSGRTLTLPSTRMVAQPSDLKGVGLKKSR